MPDYFIPNEFCPKSKELLKHSDITTVRCGSCGFLNPDYTESPIKLPERDITIPFDREIIALDEDESSRQVLFHWSNVEDLLAFNTLRFQISNKDMQTKKGKGSISVLQTRKPKQVLQLLRQ